MEGSQNKYRRNGAGGEISMKYQSFDLLYDEELDQDILGNPITDGKVLDTILGRFTPWTANEIKLLGREMTTANRKVLTRATRNLLEKADRIQDDGSCYTIEQILDLGIRWRLLYVKGYRL